jgi:hypothetical protein
MTRSCRDDRHTDPPTLGVERVAVVREDHAEMEPTHEETLTVAGRVDASALSEVP